MTAPIVKRPEPSPRPADCRFVWNGFYWERNFRGFTFTVHINLDGTGKVKSYSACATDPGASRFAGRDCGYLAMAVDDAKHLGRCLLAYLDELDLLDEIEKTIPFGGGQ